MTYSNNRTTDRESGHVEKTRGWGGTAAADLRLGRFGLHTHARAEVQRSAAQLQSAALRARSRSRTNWARYRTAWDLAHQQQAEVLPLAKQVQDETVLRYNGMFDSVWQLLAQARTTTRRWSARPMRSAISGWPKPICNWR